MAFRTLIQESRPKLPSFDRRFVLFYWDKQETTDGKTKWVPVLEPFFFATDVAFEIQELVDQGVPFVVFNLYGDALPNVIQEALEEISADDTVDLPAWLEAYDLAEVA